MGSFINRLRLRANMVQEDLVVMSIPITAWRKAATWQELGSSGSEPDMGLGFGTFGTSSSRLNSPIVNQNSKYGMARVLVPLPECYVAGQSLSIVFSTILDVAVAVEQTLDLEVYKADRVTGVGSDICATAKQNIATSYGDLPFVITPTGLVRGDVLDCRLTVLLNDTGGTAANKKASIAATELLIDIKG